MDSYVLSTSLLCSFFCLLCWLPLKIRKETYSQRVWHCTHQLCKLRTLKFFFNLFCYVFFSCWWGPLTATVRKNFTASLPTSSSSWPWGLWLAWSRMKSLGRSSKLKVNFLASAPVTAVAHYIFRAASMCYGTKLCSTEQADYIHPAASVFPPRGNKANWE